MAAAVLKSVLLVGLVLASTLASVNGRRAFDQRRDLKDVLPAADSGWTVPLQGGETCSSAGNCTNMLPAPPVDKTLKLLTLARGILTYSCVGVDPSFPPTFITQDTQLFDATPLIPLLADENAFHALVPELYTYDYGSLDNSTLTCVGEIFTEDGYEVTSLNSFGSFTVQVSSVVEPSENPAFNADWARSVSEDDTWNVYRVETFGGAPPAYCQGQNETVELGYAAEYWFFNA